MERVRRGRERAGPADFRLAVSRFMVKRLLDSGCPPEKLRDVAAGTADLKGKVLLSLPPSAL